MSDAGDDRSIPWRWFSHDPVGNAIRMELVLDIFPEANLPHALDLAGHGAVADPVQNMDNRLLIVGRRGAVQSRVDARRGQHERSKECDFRPLHTRLRHTAALER